MHKAHAIKSGLTVAHPTTDDSIQGWTFFSHTL